MSNPVITRLVVGKPTTVCLGRPVGQRFANGNAQDQLRWKEGAWIKHGSTTFAGLFKRPAPTTIKLPTRRLSAVVPGRRTAWAAAAVLFVALGAGMGVLWRSPSEGFLPVPAAAKQEAGSAVKIVAAPYTPSHQVLEVPASGMQSPLPGLPIGGPNSAPELVVPSVPGPMPSAAAPAVAAPTSVVSVAAKTAAKASSKDQGDQQAKPPAVVLDEVAPQRPIAAAQITPPAAQSATLAAVQAPAKPASIPQPAAKAETPAKVVSAAAPVTATGLIAITPDGKAAVFTNPKTRLPQQFKVGDLLPGGDTIRSIDHNSGKVLTSSKEYHLD